MKTNKNVSLLDFSHSKLNTEEPLPFETSVQKFTINEIITQENEIEKKLYFIRSGILQVNFMDENGEDRIISFAFQNQFCSSLSSLISQKPTVYNITCLTDCVLEVIKRDDLYEALEHSIIANKIYRSFLESAYLVRLNKQVDFLSKDAKRRYKDLLKLEPEIAKLLPQSKIAQYLGIHSRSLSRLRKQIKQE